MNANNFNSFIHSSCLCSRAPSSLVSGWVFFFWVRRKNWFNVVPLFRPAITNFKACASLSSTVPPCSSSLSITFRTAVMIAFLNENVLVNVLPRPWRHLDLKVLFNIHSEGRPSTPLNHFSQCLSRDTLLGNIVGSTSSSVLGGT
ncbi:hypothetical protein KVV02_007771 [Mortierella alpina]|uniref:Uncharacterized protein n=1 Tax=Mortierella alpina TaxID=64518 RepID=A0A9P8CYP2_MORAP|nr:hypothetical protein KVV02_007771 [Mortierella alpina]